MWAKNRLFANLSALHDLDHVTVSPPARVAAHHGQADRAM